MIVSRQRKSRFASTQPHALMASRSDPLAVGLTARVLARLDTAVNRLYGSRCNPLYRSGAATAALIVLLLVTGLYLLLFYRVGAPYESVARITGQVWLGRWVRSLHRFAADAAVVTATIHAIRMFAQGRSWGPRTMPGSPESGWWRFSWYVAGRAT
jgi:quinol-cytochrome oxidoreductase complex cytochrome b subunit